MERLWAPWRMIYIKKIEEEEGCIFCEKPKSNRDEENLILFRGERTFVLMNLYPYNSGHLMVAPYKHTGNLGDLSEVEGSELFRLIRLSIEVLKKVLKPDGFNVGLNLGRISGAGYEDHLHFHIVPRWNGDTNFMPIIADTKVIPEALEETYRALKPVFVKLASKEGRRG
jgi:ATP adenylyltransferase